MEKNPLTIFQLFGAFTAGTLFMTWRNHLSLKMNLLGYIFDRIELFPNFVSIKNEKESMELLQRHRRSWYLGEILSYLDGPRMAKQKDFQIPSREVGRTILVRVYQPKLTQKVNELPIVLFVHGGGWSFGSIQVYDNLVRSIAEASQCIFASVEYRLSPEHKFPNGLQDCEDALKWISGHPAELFQQEFPMASKTKLGICGDSAGGNYCASLAVFAKNSGINLAIQCLIYPATSAFCIPHWRQPPLPLSTDSAVLYSQGPLLNFSPIVWGWNLYLSDPNQAYDPRASPILYSLEDLKDTAPAFVVTAGCDMLKDEAFNYAKKLEEAGVKVEYRNYPNTIHAFLSLHFSDFRGEIHGDLCQALRAAFSNNTPSSFL